MVAGKDAAVPGEGKNSWLTGTAAWMWYTISQYILGVKPTYDGLIIDPCIPAEWKHFEVKRRFRGAIYNIIVSNVSGAQKGVKSIMFDGKPVDGNFVPACKSGEHEVVVSM